MFPLILEGFLVVGVLGFLIKWGLDYKEHKLALDNNEFAVATIIVLLIFVPLTAWIGTKVAINNQLTFHENWGGYETQAERIVSSCQRDGNMKNYYKGDPYKYEWDTHDDEVDSKGRHHSVTHHHSETRYHNIPFCSEEWTFVVRTTLGDYTIADRNLPDNPNEYRYRAYVSVPDYLDHGTPDFWTLAKHRLDSGNPAP